MVFWGTGSELQTSANFYVTYRLSHEMCCLSFRFLSISLVAFTVEKSIGNNKGRISLGLRKLHVHHSIDISWWCAHLLGECHLSYLSCRWGAHSSWNSWGYTQSKNCKYLKSTEYFPRWSSRTPLNWTKRIIQHYSKHRDRRKRKHFVCSLAYVRSTDHL